MYRSSSIKRGLFFLFFFERPELTELTVECFIFTVVFLLALPPNGVISNHRGKKSLKKKSHDGSIAGEAINASLARN